MNGHEHQGLNLSGATNETVPNKRFNDIVVPNHNGRVSHIAVDIGGSMAKVVYFTTNEGHRGGRLHFEVFETDSIDKLIDFIESLIKTKESFNLLNYEFNFNSQVNLKEMLNESKIETPGYNINYNSSITESPPPNEVDEHNLFSESPKSNKPIIKATGGGAHLFGKKLEEKLGVDVHTEDEMECLITGLNFFIQEVSDEVFIYRENDLPIFEKISKKDMFPYLLVNIGSGVSIIKVTDENTYERISGTSLGGGTFWGLLHLLTGSQSFDEMLEISKTGDNSKVDMMVGDIYGTHYDKIGLKATAIASTMGGVYRKKLNKKYDNADIARSLLYMVSHRLTMHTLSYAINFWSKGTMNAMFMRHEGFLGAVGAFIKADPSLLPSKPTHRSRGGSFQENFVLTQGLEEGSISALGILDRVSSKLLPLPQLILNTNSNYKYHQNSLALISNTKYTFLKGNENFGIYDPDTLDLINNSDFRNEFIDVMLLNTQNLVELATSGKLPVKSKEGIKLLNDFKDLYSEKLSTLKKVPTAYGRLTIRTILNLREQCLNEIGLDDLFYNIKMSENDMAISLLPEALKAVDQITDKKELFETLIKKVLIGKFVL
ncbi:hypothetical protein BB559_005684 [Furculomyces boomerangus]|uniref:Damage-control phosphatase ARMT1-like metal-binding domain-containing protein n=1 Tax=Furculomyces boomerangus TaxID=61424 RepID=A0A2T9Y7F5_9FUNG|nr:hypothetical protein BB559_005684 [Furculomyces boomerangus]